MNKINKNISFIDLKFEDLPVNTQFERSIQAYKIVQYGMDNLYPQYLYKTYHNSSPKHSAIINRKANMTSGNGFDLNNVTDNAINFLSNPYSNQTLNDAVRMGAYDLEVLYYMTFEIVYSRDLKTISTINYLPAQKVRLGVVEEGVVEEKHYLYSKDWSNPRRNENKVKVYPAYSAGRNNNPVELLFIPFYQGFSEFYPVPGYKSSLEYIEVDRQISVFHNKQLTNGFTGGYMLNFVGGVPTEDEKYTFNREFKSTFTGVENAGNPIITWSDDKDTAPILTPLESNDSADKFIQLEESVTSNIMMGHEVTSPELFGLTVPGQLGNSDMIESLDIFQAVYIDARQKLIEDAFNSLFKFNYPLDDSILKLNKFKLKNNTND